MIFEKRLILKRKSAKADYQAYEEYSRYMVFFYVIQCSVLKGV